MSAGTPNADDIARLWPHAGEIECIYVIGEPIDRVPSFAVGVGPVTRIEKTAKPGEYGWIPYVRVWAGDRVLSEHSQHQIAGVYFKEPA